jgi:hypothetical protein
MKKPNTVIPIEDNRVYFLFRRGKYEHIKALYEEGEVYINSIDFIRTCDNNEERADKDDGIFYRDFIREAKITICEAAIWGFEKVENILSLINSGAKAKLKFFKYPYCSKPLLISGN